MPLLAHTVIPAGSTDAALTSGSREVTLRRLIVVVSVSLTATVSIKDGASGSAVTLLPATVAIGTQVIEFGATSSSGGWRITTGAGCSVVAIWGST